MDWRQALDSAKGIFNQLSSGSQTFALAVIAVGMLAVLAVTFIDRKHWSRGPKSAPKGPLPVVTSGAIEPAGGAAIAKPKGPSAPQLQPAAAKPATSATPGADNLEVHREETSGAPAKPAAALPTAKAVAPSTAQAAEPVDEEALSLASTSLAPLDRVFPAKPLPFIVLVLVISIGAWLAGLALAPDRKAFIASPEWRFMPLYLAAHLIAVRLFVTAFTRNFKAGVQHLDVPPSEAVQGLRIILGPIGIVLAALIAVPFCYLDYRYMTGAASRYERMGAGGEVGAIDLCMWATWCLEWLLNALIWVMLLGFLVKNCRTITAYAFHSPIEIVVAERHYRPFLQMSAQGATIVTGFSAVTIFYLWYTGGELTDYAGLAITAGLLLIGFLPPWVLLRRKVRQSVDAEAQSLRHSVLNAMWREAQAKKAGASKTRTSKDEPPPNSPATLEQRLVEALAIFRISHLEQLKLNLGRREARAIGVRLLAPAIGVAWQLSQNFQALTAKLDVFLKGLAAMLSRWM